jgi:hypothetical protein
MRPGCYDVDARVRDMDINGVWASVNFPSQITGFCGRVFFNARDRELGLACVRAWNDWLFEEWYEAHPDRIIPLGITYLADPEHGRGRDPPQRRPRLHLGDPARAAPRDRAALAVGPGHWDPIIEACVETDTVVSLHVGSSGMPQAPPGAPACNSGPRCSARCRCGVRRVAVVGLPLPELRSSRSP